MFCELNWKKIWSQERFASSKQLFVVDNFATKNKFTSVYIIYALRKVSENFQENIIGGVL